MKFITKGPQSEFPIHRAIVTDGNYIFHTILITHYSQVQIQFENIGLMLNEYPQLFVSRTKSNSPSNKLLHYYGAKLNPRTSAVDFLKFKLQSFMTRADKISHLINGDSIN